MKLNWGLAALVMGVLGAARPGVGQAAPQPQSPAPPAPASGPETAPYVPRRPPPVDAAAAADLACTSRPECWELGWCTAAGGRCIAAHSADCERSQACMIGQCTAVAGRCVVASRADCVRSVGCRLRGSCFARDGQCVNRAGGTTDPGDGSSDLFTAGMVLTFVGLAVGALGVGLMVYALNAEYREGVYFKDFGKGLATAGSGLLIAVGAGATVTGIILWAVGGSGTAKERAVHPPPRPALGLALSPGFAGLSGTF